MNFHVNYRILGVSAGLFLSGLGSGLGAPAETSIALPVVPLELGSAETTAGETPISKADSKEAALKSPGSIPSPPQSGLTPPPIEQNAETEETVDEEIARLELERRLLTARAALEKEALAAEQKERREAMEREKFELSERKHRLEKEVLELRESAARLKAEKDLASASADLVLGDLRLDENKVKTHLSTLTLEMAVQEKEFATRLYTETAPKYLVNPLSDDTLTISDRRIALNGVITARTATEISARIQFFNNSDSKKPIFIVIDDSPGGSVMAGYHILKAMEGSAAPVYVVVKQFAASMAACITTLADRSFAYPNAVLLHHQISSGIHGNLTQQREGLAEVEEWWRRLAAPVAKKMGISTDDFIKQMYDKVSSGDWTEFADNAQKLKWVDHVVNEIRETGQQKHPDAPKVTSSTRSILSPTRISEAADNTDSPSPGIDSDGRPILLLPRPNPIDKFYLHNPDSYYRFR